MKTPAEFRAFMSKPAPPMRRTFISKIPLIRVEKSKAEVRKMLKEGYDKLKLEELKGSIK
mgnify:CR=1 FL=1